MATGFKPDAAWSDEAIDFIAEWGGIPDIKDVRSVCSDLSADAELKSSMESVAGSVSDYAEVLWHWILVVSGIAIV